MAAILDFRLPVTFDNHPNSTTGMADPENMRVTVGILFLAGIEPDIYTGCNVNVMIFLYFRFQAAILEYWLVMDFL